MDRSAVLATKIRTAFAPCSLGTWPAPLEAHPALARALGLQALWLKREDLTGGNKVRGLEFLLAGVPPRSVFVTVGATGSSHCLATARSAKTQGYRTAVATFPQPDTGVSRAVAACTTATANLVVSASSLFTLPWAVLRAWRAAHHLGRGAPHWIPGGGADPRAVLGQFLAALELGSQLDAPPDTIVVPLGTGGTAAGIARVVEAMGKGYGHPTPQGERARALAAEHNLRLDPTYGAKAFGFLQRSDVNVQRVVFWHTFAWP